MVKIRVPDGHDEEYVALQGTAPRESAMRMGAPRDAHVRIEDGEDHTIQIRRDEDGRYIGAREQHADAIRAYFAEEYGVEYDTDDDESDPVAEVQAAHWNAAKTDILDGEYDGALDALADADLSDTKAEAVEERRAALAEDGD